MNQDQPNAAQSVDSSCPAVTHDLRAHIRALGHKVLYVRWRAADALVRRGGPAVPALIDALAGESCLMRRGAATILGSIGDTRAVSVLIATLADSDARVREAATEALGALGDARAVASLIEALADPDDLVRGSAAEALGEIGDAGAVSALVEALLGSDICCRRCAARALGAIGDARAIPALVNALNDRDQFVVANAEEALGAFGSSRTLPLCIVATDLLTPAEKLESLRALRSPWGREIHATFAYRLPPVDAYCRSLLNRTDLGDDVKEGAREVIAEIRNREAAMTLVRPTAASAKTDHGQLLRAASDESLAIPSGQLLRPSEPAADPIRIDDEDGQ